MRTALWALFIAILIWIAASTVFTFLLTILPYLLFAGLIFFIWLILKVIDSLK